MHRPRYYSPPPPAPKSSKPSKIIWVLALVAACVLPYLLVKGFSAKSSHQYRRDDAHEEKVVVTPPVAEKKSHNEHETVIPLPAPQLQKAVESTPNHPIDNWLTLKTSSGDSLSTIFKRVGLSSQTLQEIMQRNPYQSDLTRIKIGQELRFLIKKNELEQLVFKVNDRNTLTITREKGHYLSKLQSRKLDVRDSYLTATVQYSLYSTAKRHNIPSKLIQQMTHIFEREINFAKEVRGGDRFTIIYKASYLDSKMVDVGDIIAVTYTTSRGAVHQALQHVNHGDVDYFTPEGESMQPGFSRYPIKFSRINSPFSLSRMHPILHYSRPHKGIDLAAPMGTPILATGDGRVEVLGYENGYGNVIKIAHHNRIYTSVYAHLMKFKKGLFRGSDVKRGDVIGYVGKSGLASGPHCHYEFHVNHQPKNPTTVSLPHASSVPSRDLASFKAHADKLIEHLKLYEEGHLASKSNRGVG